MSRSTTSQSRKRSSASTQTPATTPKTTRTSPYDGDFQQKLTDLGIYPNNKASKPQNLHEIRESLTRPRASLSPSKFGEDEFEAFKDACEALPSEPKAMDHALNVIVGKSDRQHPQEKGIPFNHLQRFDVALTVPVPDVYYGAPPSTIDKRVRGDLGEYITPSTKTYRPAVPNFFLEGKSSSGRPDVAKNQAMYDGAIGARAMHKVQNYGLDEPVYDNKAYSFSSTYQDGHLQLYTTHLTAPTIPGGNPEYHMTKLDAFSLTGNAKSFREGATVYRNNRDLAMTHRDSFIEQANERARQLPISGSKSTFSDSRTSRSPLMVNSDTSEDELARNDLTPVKRPKHPPARPSNELTTRRSSRTGSSLTPQRSTGTDFPPLHDQGSPTAMGRGNPPRKE